MKAEFPKHALFVILQANTAAADGFQATVHVWHSQSTTVLQSLYFYTLCLLVTALQIVIEHLTSCVWASTAALGGHCIVFDKSRIQ